MKHILVFSFAVCSLLFTSVNCSHLSTGSREPAAEHPAVMIEFQTHEDLESFRSFDKDYIKFVVDVSEEKWTIRFFNPKKYELHTEFLRTFDQLDEQAESLYQKAHFNDGRKYFFGALVGNLSGNGDQSFQLSAIDVITVEDLLRVNTLVSNALKYETTLTYNPSGAQKDFVFKNKIREQLKSSGLDLLDRGVTKSEVYASGFTVGRLKIVNAEDIESGEYVPQVDDVLVLNYVPVTLTPVRGVITGSASSSNSHVSLLTDMLSIPFVYIVDATELDAFKKLDGKKVFFKPFDSSEGSNPFTVMEIPEDVYTKFDLVIKNRFPEIPLTPSIKNIESFRKFPVLGTVDEKLNKDLCGAKATNSNFLRASLSEEFGAVLGKEKSLDGFCVPFYYFDVFMKSNKIGSENLREYALRLLDELGPEARIEEIQAATLNIRKAIQAAKVSETYLKLIAENVLNHFKSSPEVKKVRFRSSSNAEDDKRFNGAGLYDSDGVKLKHFKKNNLEKIEEALKIVWASVYSSRAYIARRQFKIVESKVFMAVLINQSFDEDARGVALCKQTVDYEENKDLECKVEGFPGGELKVTHPPKGRISEVSIMKSMTGYNGDKRLNTRVVQNSSEFPKGENLFTKEESQELFDIFKTIQKSWKLQKNSDPNVELDFEWKRMKRPDGTKYMLVKQVREVPQLEVAGFAEPTLMLDDSVSLISIGNKDFGPVTHGSWAEYQIKMPLLVPFKDLKRDYSRAEISSSDVFYENRPLKIKKVNSFIEEDWVRDTYYKEFEYKTYRMVFETDHPSYEDLNMAMVYKAVKKNGKVITDNIITVDTIELDRFVSRKKHYPYWKLEHAEYKDNKRGRFVYSGTEVKDSGMYASLKRSHSFCDKGEKIVQVDLIKAAHSHYPEDGVYPGEKMMLFSQFLPTKISEDFTIEGNFAVIGQGDSHAADDANSGDRDKVSYEYSGYITKKQQEALGLKKARFFVLTRRDGGPSQGVYYSTFDINMNLLRQEKIDRYCPGENPDGEGRVDPAFNGAG